MKSRLLIAAFVAALTTSFAAVAADEAAKDGAAPAEKAEKAQKAKKKVKRHSHAAEKGVAAPSGADAPAPDGEAKKPLHDHNKFNK